MHEWNGWTPDAPGRGKRRESGDGPDLCLEEEPAEPEDRDLTLIDSETFYDLLMEQQEQM